MLTSLPTAPNIEHLKKQAKDLRKSHERHDPRCCQVLKLLHHFSTLSDDEIFNASLALSDAQYALAMSYGFKSWRALRDHVGSIRQGEVGIERPDLSRLSLQGNGHTQDSFSLSVRAACGLMGQDVDYETVYALSTNSFTPALDTGEPSKCWWSSTYGGDTGIDLVADGLGLTVRSLEIDETKIPPEPSEQDAARAWYLQHIRMPQIGMIRQAQRRGEVVMVWREWTVNGGPHGFVPWAWWGLITETRDDGVVLGAALNGHHDNPLDWLGGLYALGPGQKNARSTHDRGFLERILHRIRGDTPPFISPDQRILFGLPAMDAWIRQMCIVPFCSSCGDNPDYRWTCARDTAMPAYEGSKASAKYLRELARRLPKSAQQYVTTAAECYHRIRDLLGPAILQDSSLRYETFMGDLDKQQKHAETVLRPARSQLSQAAKAIEKALVVMSA